MAGCLAAALALSCRAPLGQDPVPALVFGAASLADVLPEACGAGQPPAAFAFGASNDLARQVLAGAPADVVVLAGEEPMAALVRGGRVAAGDVVRVAGNELVVITRRGASFRITGLHDLATLSSVAIADPEAVPAGVHARRWLEAVGAWAAVEPVVVPTLDVRAALSAVVSGAAEAGLVYATDAAMSSNVQIVLRAPREAVDVAYLAAPVRDGRRQQAEALLAVLRGDEARATFRRHGFLVDGPG